MQVTYWYMTCAEGWVQTTQASYEHMKKFGVAVAVGPPAPTRKALFSGIAESREFGMQSRRVIERRRSA